MRGKTCVLLLALAATQGCGLVPLGFRVVTTSHVEPPLSRKPPRFVVKPSAVPELDVAHFARFAEARPGMLSDVRAGEVFLDARCDDSCPCTIECGVIFTYSLLVMIPDFLVGLPPLVDHRRRNEIRIDAYDREGRHLGYGSSRGSFVTVGTIGYFVLLAGGPHTFDPHGAAPDLGEALEDLLEHMEQEP